MFVYPLPVVKSGLKCIYTKKAQTQPYSRPGLLQPLYIYG